MLFHKYQGALLATMFEYPYEALSINELARRAGVDPGNTKRYVEKFAQNGFVTLTPKGNAVLIRPDLSNQEILKVFELFEITRANSFLNENQVVGGMLKEVANALYGNLPEVRMVCLFGPSAQAISTSCPIDLGIIVGAGLNAPETARLASDIIKRFALPYETRLCLHGTADMANIWKKGDGCSVEIWNTRIVLFGEGYFWQTIAEDGIPCKPEQIEKTVEMADHV
jgi:hypothetical protein